MPLIIINATTRERITQQHVTTANMRDICRAYLTNPDHLGERLQVIREETGEIEFDVTSIKYSTGTVRMTLYSVYQQKSQMRKVAGEQNNTTAKTAGKKVGKAAVSSVNAEINESVQSFRERVQKYNDYILTQSPWKEHKHLFFCPDEENLIRDYNLTCSRKEYVINLRYPFQCILGCPAAAKIGILAENPHIDNQLIDPFYAKDDPIPSPEKLAVLEKQYNGTINYWYCIGDQTNFSGEHGYWFDKILGEDSLIRLFFSEKNKSETELIDWVKRSCAEVEMQGYHSAEFRKFRFPHWEQAKKAVRNWINDGKLIFISRAINTWRKVIPELDCYIENYPQNVICPSTKVFPKPFFTEKNLILAADYRSDFSNLDEVIRNKFHKKAAEAIREYLEKTVDF